MLLYSYTEWTSVETKQEIETLQETISSLNIQLKEKDENIKGIIINCGSLGGAKLNSILSLIPSCPYSKQAKRSSGI